MLRLFGLLTIFHQPQPSYNADVQNPSYESGCLEFPEIPPAEHPERRHPCPYGGHRSQTISREVAQHLSSASQMPTEPGRN